MTTLDIKLSLPEPLATGKPEYTEADLESELKAVRAELREVRARGRGISA